MLGFRIPLAGFRIPKPWIPDSTDQNYLDSGFRITLHGASQRKGVVVGEGEFFFLALKKNERKIKQRLCTGYIVDYICKNHGITDLRNTPHMIGSWL